LVHDPISIGPKPDPLRFVTFMRPLLGPRVVLLTALSAAALAAVLWCAKDLPWLDLAWLRGQQSALLAQQAAHPLTFTTCLFMAFAALSAFAVPGCSVLALAAGLCLGLMPGTLLVGLASTVGATLSFLAARFWWRDAVQKRWGHRLAGLEQSLARDGAYYLFSLRLAPVIPYALVNPLMGLSAMPTGRFFAVSFLGMLPGSAVYVYAGTVFSQVQSWQALFTPHLVGGFAVLAALPWLARWTSLRLKGAAL
jgi:uncharacterized membrane protein YdjX (TVP38/TMEM64 family)